MQKKNRALTIPSNPHEDDDGDGYTNLEEWLHSFANELEEIPSDNYMTEIEETSSDNKNVYENQKVMDGARIFNFSLLSYWQKSLNNVINSLLLNFYKLIKTYS